MRRTTKGPHPFDEIVKNNLFSTLRKGLKIEPPRMVGRGGGVAVDAPSGRILTATSNKSLIY
jgi:hypothetical protein